MLKNQKGITLIALIITIIILLILAGISLGAILGDNGILSKATSSSQATIVGREKEAIALGWSPLLSEKLANNVEITDSSFEDELNNDGNDVTVSYDEDGNYIVHFNDTGHNYLVNKITGKTEEYDGTIEEVEPTDIYVTLYTDGTLGFCSTEDKIEGKTVSKEYGNIKGQEYTYSATNNYDGTTDSPWFNDRASILKVDFVDTVIPTSTACWFLKCQQLNEIYHIENLNTQLVTNMAQTFFACLSLKTIDVSGFNTKNVTSMFSIFSGGYMGVMQLENLIGLTNWNTKNVTNMAGLFFRCGNLTSLDVSRFNTSKVTDMESIFNGCTKLTSLDVSNFNTGNVTNMSYMFCGHYEDTVMALQEIRGLENFNTKNATRMEGMFYRCSNLTSLDLSHFDTSKVENMFAMFDFCSGLTTLNVSNFNTESVTNMSAMFGNCTGLITLDLSNFDTSHVITMESMFDGSSNLTTLNLANFDTSSCTNLTGLFFQCGSLETIYVLNDWNMSNVTEDRDVFSFCTSLKGGNETNYSWSYTNKTYARIDKSGQAGYFTQYVNA